MPREISQAYASYLTKGDKLLSILQDRLTNLTEGKKLQALLAKGTDTLRYPNGKVLNITEQGEKGLQYNRQLIETAVLAGLQWLQTAPQFQGQMDEDTVASLTGLDRDAVTDPMVNALTVSGLFAVPAKLTMAQKISEFWGLSTGPDSLDGYTQGIPEAVAAELLEAMITSQDLSKNLLDFKDRNGKIIAGMEGVKPINFYTPAKLSDEHQAIASSPSLIERAVLVTPQDVTYFDNEDPPVADTQLRNPAVRNTPEQKEMIKNEQATRFYLNMPMVNLLSDLGLDNVLRLFGAGKLDPETMNESHFLSLDGKNRTIEGAFDALSDMVAETKARADAAGVEPDQMGIRPAYNITRVGRLQMLGRYNMQSTKLIREAVLSTRSTMDLSNQNSLEYGKFMLGLAQALGLKVHKQSLAASIAGVNKLLAGPLAPSVEDLREFHATQKAPASLTDNLVSNFGAMNDGRGEPLTTVALHALTEYARLQEVDDKARKAFTTSIYVEADGVTNGPMMGMKLLTAGKFTADWVAKMAKGGLFFQAGTNGPKTMGEQHEWGVENGGDSKDLYQTMTDTLQQTFAQHEGLLTDSKVKAQLGHLKNLMDQFLPDFEIQDKKLVMSRGIAKNPLTITIYGSGEAGIAGKLVGAIMDQLYERMTAVAQRQAANPKMTTAEAMFGKQATDLKSAQDMYAKFLQSFNALKSNEFIKNARAGCNRHLRPVVIAT
jgi:hypothetical protein